MKTRRGKKTPKAKKSVKRAKPSKTSTRRYEGAAKTKRLSRWTTPSSSANDALASGISTLRNRARDLRRNNPYAAKAVQVITSNVVGHGIKTQFRRAQGGDVSELERQWRAWAGTTEIDFDGRNNIFGLQRLVMDAVVESGEVLIRRRVNSAKEFPLQFQVLESDFLDTNKTESTSSGGYIIQGIEFDSQGRRVAYHLYETHPGETTTGAAFSLKSNRVPVDEIFHVYRMDRPGQARGVTWLAPVIVRLRDLDDFEDAQLVRQKIAACFTAFVRDIGPDMTDADEDCDEVELGERLEPGIIEHLPNGKEIQFANPPEVQNYNQYVSANLRSIAAGVGVTYEALSGDYSQVNFSSARMGWLEFGRNLRTWRRGVMVDLFLDPVAKAFLGFASILGAGTEEVSAFHVAPSREHIDPAKEVPAAIESVRAGFSTLSDELMALGKDPEEHFEQFKKDLDTLDQLGLKLESDPRVKPGEGDGSTDSGGEENVSTQDQSSET